VRICRKFRGGVAAAGEVLESDDIGSLQCVECTDTKRAVAVGNRAHLLETLAHRR
jgi:hypothetical protein